jgi:dienelactone hydrolase
LRPGERISIAAALVDGAGQSWASQADFSADVEGNVDVSKQAPVSGSYKEASATGLIWSMRPAAKGVEVYRPPAIFTPQTIRFRLLRNGVELAAAQLNQFQTRRGEHSIKLSGPLHGDLFLPSEPGPHPGVLVLGGSGGGVPTAMAVWLAAHGFAALALAYFRYEDLPTLLEGIPLEYFGTALSWMMQRPEIRPDRIAVLGGSRGGELALQLGSMYPQLRAVVAYVPGSMRHAACCGNTRVPYAWTWRGLPLPYLPPRQPATPEIRLQATIKVEQTHGPVLLISGESDGVWESSSMADDIMSRLKRAHFEYPFEHLKYPHAGHWAGTPQITPAWHGLVRNPTSGREIDPGGTVAGNAQSSIDAAPKVIRFLQQSLN